MMNSQDDRYFNIKLTEEQRMWCEYRLRNWTSVSRRLGDENLYTVSRLRLMIRYEMETRRRKESLDRMIARLAKLIRRVYVQETKDFMKSRVAKDITILFDPKDLKV